MAPADLVAPYARANRLGGMTIAEAAWAHVPLDQLGASSGVTLVSGSLVIATPGVYAITAAISFGAGAAGARVSQVQVSGLVIATTWGEATTGRSTHPVSDVRTLVAGDVVSLHAWQTGQASLSIEAGATTTHLAVARLGAAA